MTTKDPGCMTDIIGRYVNCGCSRKMKRDPIEGFEIVNIEDIRPDIGMTEVNFGDQVYITSSLESTKLSKENEVCGRTSNNNLDRYFMRSLTNAASPKSSLSLTLEETLKRGQLATQSGPNLNQASMMKPLPGWQKVKAVFKRSGASEGAIVTNPKYTIEEQIEAYKNIWRYDSSKEYYYEDIKAAGALLIDLPPEMLINMKYREGPFNKRSAEEVVKGYLARIWPEKA